MPVALLPRLHAIVASALVSRFLTGRSPVRSFRYVDTLSLNRADVIVLVQRLHTDGADIILSLGAALNTCFGMCLRFVPVVT